MRRREYFINFEIKKKFDFVFQLTSKRVNDTTSKWYNVLFHKFRDKKIINFVFQLTSKHLNDDTMYYFINFEMKIKLILYSNSLLNVQMILSLHGTMCYVANSRSKKLNWYFNLLYEHVNDTPFFYQ